MKNSVRCDFLCADGSPCGNRVRVDDRSRVKDWLGMPLGIGCSTHIKALSRGGRCLMRSGTAVQLQDVGLRRVSPKPGPVCDCCCEEIPPGTRRRRCRMQRCNHMHCIGCGDADQCACCHTEIQVRRKSPV